MNFSDNEIDEIHPKIFDNLKNLTQLNFPDNKLTVLDSKLFNRLACLKNLEIGGNKVNELSIDLFEPCKDLENLDIRNVGLKSFSSSSSYYCSMKIVFMRSASILIDALWQFQDACRV